MIGAIVLAAGLSRRMGQPKLVLPWGNTTIIGQVVDVLLRSDVKPVVVVTGGAHEKVAEALNGITVKLVFNERYQEDQMTFSLQAGIQALSGKSKAVLVVLGDQPQIKEHIVRAVMDEYRISEAPLIVPSYQMRRGHPWLVERSLWPELLAIRPPQTLRDFLSNRASQIHYLNVNTITVLQDLDTPEDYQQYVPK